MSWQLDKIGFGGDGRVKKTQKTSDIINGCSLKPTNSWTPLSKHGPPKDTTVPVFQWRASCCLSWEAVMVTTDLPLVNMYLQMEMHLQPGPDLADGSISSSSIGHHQSPPWHRRHLTNHCHPWHFDRSSVWLCYLQQSNAWQQRSLSLQWEDIGPSPLLKS